MPEPKPSQGFWGTGKQHHLFQGNKGTKVKKKKIRNQGNKGKFGEHGT